jgi:hypothetical protein
MTTKKKIIDRLVYFQQSLIAELDKTVQGFQQGADLTEGEVTDPEDASFQNNAMDMLHSYQSRLNAATNELTKLENLIDSENTDAVAGALVDAGDVLFYLGISTKPILLEDGRQLIGISLDSEIANQLSGKKPGQSIQFGDSTLTIKSIQ